jgi:hypothetical protein
MSYPFARCRSNGAGFFFPGFGRLKNSAQMPTLVFFLSVIDCFFELIEKIFQRMYLFEWGQLAELLLILPRF